jgi:hypothetical protein
MIDPDPTGASSSAPHAALDPASPVLPGSVPAATGPVPFDVPAQVDFAHVLGHLRPGSAWAIVGNRYDQIVWHDATQSMPTLAECVAVWPQVALAQVNDHVRSLRQEALEREADSLFFQVSAGELDRSVWLAKRDEIRRRHPYYTLDADADVHAAVDADVHAAADADVHAAAGALPSNDAPGAKSEVAGEVAGEAQSGPQPDAASAVEDGMVV